MHWRTTGASALHEHCNEDKSSVSAVISDLVELQWIQRTQWRLLTARWPVIILEATVFLGRVAFKLVETKLVCVKMVINLWRSSLPEKSYCKKRPVYAVGGYTHRDRYSPISMGIPGRKKGLQTSSSLRLRSLLSVVVPTRFILRLIN